MEFEQRLLEVVGRVMSSGASLGRRAAARLPDTLPRLTWPSPNGVEVNSDDYQEVDHTGDDPGPEELPMPEVRPWRSDDEEQS